MTNIRRRSLLAGAGLAAALSRLPAAARPQETEPARRKNRIGVSTYSFWGFRGPRIPIERCIDEAAAMGFDGVEILHRQMTDESNGALQAIKRRAFLAGLDLMGFSIHQDFVSPDPEERARNVEHTIRCIELAHALGIPTLRLNTGRWGTIESFDDLMAARGVEPRLEGYTDEDAVGWCIGAIEECLPHAERNGVVLGLENYWGISLQVDNMLAILAAVDSPWLMATADTGNFLEDPYDRLARLAPHTALIQAKTYLGRGRWYTLDLDYARIAGIFRRAGFAGYVSLEFESDHEPRKGIERSLALLREHFG